MKEVFQKYAHLFSSKPGRTNISHTINTGNYPPICSAAYRVNEKVLADIRRGVKEMLDLGIIKESKIDWASPIVLVK